MPGQWDGSTRGRRLPPTWPQIRGAVITRAGGRCEATQPTGQRCDNPGTDVDHITRGDNHSLNNLQLLCPHHHNRKSSREGNEARWSTYRRVSTHPNETHPGLR